MSGEFSIYSFTVSHSILIIIKGMYVLGKNRADVRNLHEENQKDLCCIVLVTHPPKRQILLLELKESIEGKNRYDGDEIQTYVERP